jgi:hypothetical protein
LGSTFEPEDLEHGRQHRAGAEIDLGVDACAVRYGGVFALTNRSSSMGGLPGGDSALPFWGEGMRRRAADGSTTSVNYGDLVFEQHLLIPSCEFFSEMRPHSCWAPR